jgi:uncharacterized protein (DUF2141 family)
MRTLALALGFAFLAGAIAEAQPGNTINVVVSGLRNDNGTVRCGLFNSAATFPTDGQEFMGAVGMPANQQATCTFNNVPPGTYAVAYFHAQQGETKLKTGLFGQPEQGYGFSRNATGTMGPPSFNAAAYSYAGGNVTFPVTITYP